MLDLLTRQLLFDRSDNLNPHTQTYIVSLLQPPFSRCCKDASLPPAPPALLSLASGLQETSQSAIKEPNHCKKKTNPKSETIQS